MRERKELKMKGGKEKRGKWTEGGIVDKRECNKVRKHGTLMSFEKEVGTIRRPIGLAC